MIEHLQGAPQGPAAKVCKPNAKEEEKQKALAQTAPAKVVKVKGNTKFKFVHVQKMAPAKVVKVKGQQKDKVCARGAFGVAGLGAHGIYIRIPNQKLSRIRRKR